MIFFSCIPNNARKMEHSDSEHSDVWSESYGIEPYDYLDETRQFDCYRCYERYKNYMTKIYNNTGDYGQMSGMALFMMKNIVDNRNNENFNLSEFILNNKHSYIDMNPEMIDENFDYQDVIEEYDVRQQLEEEAENRYRNADYKAVCEVLVKYVQCVRHWEGADFLDSLNYSDRSFIEKILEDYDYVDYMDETKSEDFYKLKL